MPNCDASGAEAPTLVFLHSFEPGGVERIALRMVAHWQAEGVPARLFMGRTEGAMHPQFAGRVQFDRAPSTRLPIRHFETLWMIVQLALHVRRTRPALLFAAGNSYAVVAVALKWLLGAKCPPVVLKISNDLVRPDMIAPVAALYRLWLRIQGRPIDRFIAMSGPLADQIAQAMGVERERIEVIANPSLDAAAPPVPCQPGNEGAGRSFCAVGRLTRQKNLPLMLRAFARGTGVEDRLTFYGDGPDRPRLQKLARRLGVADRVRFAGFVAEPANELRRHHVLLLSSHFEGIPSAVVEALASGLHVIATDCCCSMRWLLGDGILGALVARGDRAGLARAIAAAPRGQREPERARAKADLHRMDRVAPAYLRHFSAIGRASRPEFRPAPSHLSLSTGFAR
ncbi:MAG: glycosyltransferase [Sphingobium sp.]